MQQLGYIRTYSIFMAVMVFASASHMLYAHDLDLSITGAAQKKDPASGQVTYELSLGQHAQIQLSVPGGVTVQEVSIPGIDRVNLLSHIVADMTVNNYGNIRITREYRAQFSAKEEGLITLGPATIKHHGKELLSNTVLLNVVSSPRAEDVISDDKAPRFFSQFEMPKKDIVMGEALPAVCRLYTREQISRIDMRAPTLNGFVVKQVGDYSRSKEQVNGVDYQVIEVPYVLTPLSSGEHTIESFVWSALVAEQERSDFGGIFSFFGGRYKEHRVVSPKETVRVNNLPGYAHQVHGIGSFESLTAQVSEQSIAVGDLVSVKITLKGEGNIAQISEPSLTLPDAFTSFDATKEPDTGSDPFGLSGLVTFTYLIRANRPGEYEIPSQDMHLYDPQKNSFYVLSTDPLSINVSGDAGLAVPTQTGVHEPGQGAGPGDDKKILVDDIHFIKDEPLACSCSGWKLPFWVFIILFLAPMGWLVYPTIGVLLRYLQKKVGPKTPSTSADYLHKEIDRYAAENNLEGLYGLFTSFLMSHKRIPKERFSIELVQEIFLKEGWQKAQAVDFTHFLRECAKQAFAPIPLQDADLQLYVQKAHNWIDTIMHNS